MAIERVAVVRSSFSPFGGVERVAVGTIEQLLKIGIPVSLLTQPRQAWPLDHPDLDIVSLGASRGSRFWQAWRFNRAVCRYIDRQPFDIVFSLDKVARFSHLHAGGGTHRTFLSIKNRNDAPVGRWFRRLSLFHAYILHLEKIGFINPLLRSIRCNSTLVEGNIRADYAVPSDRLTVIPSSIDWTGIGEVFAARKTVAAQLAAAEGLDPSLDYLLFLGSGFHRKGLDIAITGLRYLDENYHLLVVGKGNPRRFLAFAEKIGVRRRVHVLGPRERGWRYSALCRAMVLPSRYDPFGGAAAESHAMGLPVLITDQTGYADFVDDGQNGVILPAEADDDAIRNAFLRLQALIVSPRKTPDAIRAAIDQLDHPTVAERVLNEFLMNRSLS